MATYILTNRAYLNRKVEFIKTIRSAFNMDLRTAKEIADQFSAGYNVDDDELHLEIRDLPTIHNHLDFMKILSPQDLFNIDYTRFTKATITTTTEDELREVAKRAIDRLEYQTAIQILNILD